MEPNTAPETPHILIIGGGIGGLTAANALVRHGLRVSLFERTPVLKPLGASISVWTNAMLALDRIGLADAVAAQGDVMRSAELRNQRGSCLSRINVEAHCTPLGQPSVCVHRGDLQTVLLAVLPEGTVHLGKELVAVEENADGVVARFDDGTNARGDALIGADGLNSVVRSILHGTKEPRYAGYGGWLGVTSAFEHPLHPRGLVYESWGRGRRVGAVHCGKGRVYWFVVAGGRAAIRGVRPGRRENVLQVAAGFHAPICEMIEATDEARIVELSFYDREPLESWGRGRLTLLGDAAHPMTPNIGQGACTAIEDAVQLAEHLAGPKDLAGALRTYESKRIPRTEKLVRIARKFGTIAQLTNPVACAVRNVAMRLTPDAVIRRQLTEQMAIEK